MKLKFENIVTINFVKTDKGMIDLADLDTDEFLEYCHLYQVALADNRDKRIKLKKEKKELMETKIFKVCVAYENTFKIKAENKDEAEDIATSLFWEDTQNAELLNLETEDKDLI